MGESSAHRRCAEAEERTYAKAREDPVCWWRKVSVLYCLAIPSGNGDATIGS